MVLRQYSSLLKTQNDYVAHRLTVHGVMSFVLGVMHKTLGT
jgi:hypothetical protein